MRSPLKPFGLFVCAVFSLLTCANQAIAQSNPLLPYIRGLYINEENSLLSITGHFSKANAQETVSVVIEGTTLPISDFSEGEIQCLLPRTGSGSTGRVVVLIGGRKSNIRTITTWSGTVHCQHAYQFAGKNGDWNTTSQGSDTFDMKVRFRMDAWATGFTSGIYSNPAVITLSGQGHHDYAEWDPTGSGRYSETVSGAWDLVAETNLESGGVHFNVMFEPYSENLKPKMLLDFYAYAPEAYTVNWSSTDSNGQSESGTYSRAWFDRVLSPLTIEITSNYNLQAGQAEFLEDYGEEGSSTTTYSWQFTPVESPPGIQVTFYGLNEVENAYEIEPSILRCNGWGENPQQRKGVLVSVSDILPGGSVGVFAVSTPDSGGHAAATHRAPRPHGWVRPLGGNTVDDVGNFIFPPYRGEAGFEEGGSTNHSSYGTSLRLQADEWGNADFYYIAPEISGQETIWAQLENPATGQEPIAQGSVEVRFPLLALLHDTPTRVNVGATAQHPVGWYATSSTEEALDTAATYYLHYQRADSDLFRWLNELNMLGYFTKYSQNPVLPVPGYGLMPEEPLQVNDLSLEGGGLFDVKPVTSKPVNRSAVVTELTSQWNADSGHVGHRQGKDVDIRTTHLTLQNPYTLSVVGGGCTKLSSGVTVTGETGREGWKQMRGDKRLELGLAPFRNTDYYVNANNQRVNYTQAIRDKMQGWVKQIQQRRLRLLIRALGSPSNFETFVPEGDHIHVQYK